MRIEARIMQDDLHELRGAIMRGNAQKAKESTELALQLGYSFETIINNALLPPLVACGKKTEGDEKHIPELLMTARAVQGAMHALKLTMEHHSGICIGTVVIGTVAGDMHDIGKNLVAMALSGKGFSVVDLGFDVAKDEFLSAVKRHHPNLLCLSTFISRALPELKSVIDEITDHGLRTEVTIMVGGNPVTKEFASEINADIYAETMFEAAEAAEELMHHRISKYAV